MVLPSGGSNYVKIQPGPLRVTSATDYGTGPSGLRRRPFFSSARCARRQEDEEMDTSIFGIAVPSLVALSLDPLLTTVDTAFVGLTAGSSTELAAMGVGASLVGLGLSCTSFFGSAATPLVAEKRAESGDSAALALAGRITVLGFVFGVAVLCACEALAPFIISTAHLDDGGVSLAYCRLRALSAPFVVATNALNGVLRGMGDAQAPLRAAMLAAVLNLGLDFLLIVHLGLASQGAAVATGIAEVAAAIYLLVQLKKCSSKEEATSSWRESLSPFFTASALSLARTLSLQIFLAGTTWVVSQGAEADANLAAHHILKQVYILLSFATDALAIAAQQLIPAAATAEEARRATRRVVVWGCALGAIFGAILYFAADPIVSALTSDEEVRALASLELKRTLAPLQLLSSFVFVGDGIMQGYRQFAFEAKAMLLAVLTAAVYLYFNNYESSLHLVWDSIILLQLLRGVAVLFFLTQENRLRDPPPASLDDT